MWGEGVALVRPGKHGVYTYFVDGSHGFFAAKNPEQLCREFDYALPECVRYCAVVKHFAHLAALWDSSGGEVPVA